MDLRKRILTNNECYKIGDKINVQGLMLHSTGANNPKLSRYVDAPELGDISPYHWNTHRPAGRQVCVHAFIGYDQKRNIATYQTLPWNHRGWGGGGKSNNTHIHVEICESNLDNAEYFKAVYKEAVELFAYLCKEEGLDPMKHITTHSEGYKNGIASNHADVMHWFPKHGKTMDDFRKAVRAEMGVKVADSPVTPVSTPNVSPAVAPTKSITQLAQEVIDGKHGTGDARKKALGSKHDAVQEEVNRLLNPKKVSAKPKTKSITQLAQEVIDGKHGYGVERRKSLGSQHLAVQKEVNKLLAPKSKVKSISELAQEVIKGQHGSGRDRMNSLGTNYVRVQAEVNRIARK